MRDTIVIGAGLAGLMGALALAEAGRKPLVLAKGQGTTHWTSGTVDVWGEQSGRGLRDELHGLLAARPSHPYARAGVDGIEEALARFRALMESARYPYVGSLERNVLLRPARGALRPAALPPAPRAGGASGWGGPLLRGGSHGLRAFSPPLAAANLAAQGTPARGVYLNLPP